ncbi:CAAD domain-containing protein [Pantanalinema rosaneae CENA516]|uniref:CAAD domain-containing protein n=1 Tax=Pantanalinema rosaneae TaxID=1620701 RepID=UPI003D6EA88A
MNPEVKETEFSASTDVNGDDPTMLPASTSDASQQWRQVGEKVYSFLSGLPEYLSEFFGEYKRPIITLGLIFGGIVGVKLVLAVLDALNDIPLLAPTFELVGFGYTAWFVYRYLLRASNRQELVQDIETLKDQVVGSINSTTKS